MRRAVFFEKGLLWSRVRRKEPPCEEQVAIVRLITAENRNQRAQLGEGFLEVPVFWDCAPYFLFEKNGKEKPKTWKHQEHREHRRAQRRRQEP